MYPADIESEIRLFANDCVCYREVKDLEDTLKLERFPLPLGAWDGLRYFIVALPEPSI